MTLKTSFYNQRRIPDTVYTYRGEIEDVHLEQYAFFSKHGRLIRTKMSTGSGF